ncbi:60S ribosomal protein L33B [Coemansia sp. RSA 720]|nr:60S ribosomal protein L33B [Coemansia sp. RSA 720]KAJ2543996.1 60S ribosomal protein L33B [Coemansia sp. RSA 1853]
MDTVEELDCENGFGQKINGYALYSKGRFLGFKRGQRAQHENTALIQLENVNSKEETTYYEGKRVAYLFRAPTAKKGSNIRCMWGRITRPHGNSGVVRAKFRHNLPPSAMGSTVRVMMYPSNI